MWECEFAPVHWILPMMYVLWWRRVSMCVMYTGFVAGVCTCDYLCPFSIPLLTFPMVRLRPQLACWTCSFWKTIWMETSLLSWIVFELLMCLKWKRKINIECLVLSSKAHHFRWFLCHKSKRISHRNSKFVNKINGCVSRLHIPVEDITTISYTGRESYNKVCCFLSDNAIRNSYNLVIFS